MPGADDKNYRLTLLALERDNGRHYKTMIRIRANILFHGDSFFPSRVEKELNISFINKKEPGEIGKLGKYKGVPLPYGSADLSPPNEIPWNERIIWLINAVKDKINLKVK